jgi:hypothetical protein
MKDVSFEVGIIAVFNSISDVKKGKSSNITSIS